MTAEERLKAAGWRCSRGTNPPSSHEWSRDGIDWYTQAEALVEALTAERDAAIARAERAEAEQTSLAIDAARVAVARDQALARAEAAEALAASRPEITPEDAEAFTDWREGTGHVGNGTLRGYNRVTDALRAHAAKVSR